MRAPAGWRVELYLGGTLNDETRDPAEQRVGALRDAVQRAAASVESGGMITLGELGAGVRDGLAQLAGSDLGDEDALVRTQLEAFLRRIRALAESHPGLVPASALELPADARFLRDMADFLTRRFGLEPVS